MMEDFSYKLTVVILDKLLFEIAGWCESALNETWSLSTDLSDSKICILLPIFFPQVY